MFLRLLFFILSHFKIFLGKYLGGCIIERRKKFGTTKLFPPLLYLTLWYMITIPSFDIAKEKWVEGKILYGKKLAKEIRLQLKEKVQSNGITPGLAVLLVGDDPASQVYVKNKEKAANELGFLSIVKRLDATASQEQVLAIIDQWNNDSNIHGILAQLPLPKHIDSMKTIQSILPQKDADGFHFENMGKLFSKEAGVVSCTPLGIMVMLQELGISLSGKHAVVVGRSNIVGKPMAQLLLDAGNCTVTVCHSKTKDIAEQVSQADVLVAATGVQDIFPAAAIKENAIVIDVGIHKTENGLRGDIDYAKAFERASYITPVPGGVGPMTIAMLLYNTYNNAQNIMQKNTK